MTSSRPTPTAPSRCGPNSDLFYLTGIEQEETILLLYPRCPRGEHAGDAVPARDQRCRRHLGRPQASKEEARAISGIHRVEWLSEFRPLFHRLMCECDHVYLNTNEHKRAVIEVETRDARFVKDTQARYPLHDYQRLARLLHSLRVVKSDAEVELIRQASAITRTASCELRALSNRALPRPRWRPNLPTSSSGAAVASPTPPSSPAARMPACSTTSPMTNPAERATCCCSTWRQLCQLQLRPDPHHPGQRPFHAPPTPSL